MKNICELLNIEYPIFQGAMAWVSESSLAGAVSEAGGLGIIAAGNAEGSVLREQIKKIREITDKPFGVNIMLLSPHVDEIVKIVCEEKVPVVTTGAGNPQKYIEEFNKNGIKLIPVVPTVALAKRMEKIGATAVIAEGCESGGHIGKTTTMALVPQVVDALNIPVIAAGGIADGRGMAAAFMLGAKGVQIGTRFLVAKECVIHQNYKDKVIKASDNDTVATGNITGHPVRVLKNKFSREFEKIEKEEYGKEKPDLEKIESYGIGALRKASVLGDTDEGSFMCGQICGLVKEEQTAKEIITEIYTQYCDLVYGGK